MSLESRVAALESENASLREALESLTKRLDSLDGSPSAGAKKAKKPVSSARPETASNGTPGKKPTSAKPTSAKKPTSGVNKTVAVRVKEEREDSLDAIPANRRGHYNIGNRNIHYVLPAEHAKDEKGEFPSSEAKTELTLDYVYGYNGKAAFNNLFFSKEEGKITYSVAATGVVCNPTARQQSFFIAHNEDILCLAVHPSRPVVATGQLDPKGRGTPYICVWKEDTCEMITKIIYHDRGVCAMAFSPDGKYLLTIGNDDSHSLAIWDWENTPTSKKGAKGEPLVDQMTSKSAVFSISFNPFVGGDDESKGKYEFVTVGEKLLKVWSATGLDSKDKKGRVLTSRIPSTFNKSKVVVKQFMGIGFTKDGCIEVGTDAGHIYKVKDSDLLKFWQGHDGAVTSMCNTADGFASAGEDGKVKLWGEDGKEVAVFDLSGRGKGDSVAQSLDFKNGKLLVGLTSNAILEIDASSGAVTELTAGHNDEVWALAIHPSQPFAVTGAHDKTVRVWNYSTKEAVKEKTLNLKGNVRSASFTEDGKFLAVGTWGGKVALVNFDSWEVVWNHKFAKETVDSLAFSADGSLLACGSWDQLIHVVNVSEGKEKATCKGHTSSVLMVNFSTDGKYLMSNSRDYEILYWNAENGKRVNTGEVVDTKWSAWNCFLGWAVQGIWEGAGDGTDINSVDRSKDERALACGDDFGQVRLFSYPCLNKNSAAKLYPGHSSHVTQVRFTPAGDYLFSTGGADTGVFQWRHA